MVERNPNIEIKMSVCTSVRPSVCLYVHLVYEKGLMVFAHLFLEVVDKFHRGTKNTKKWFRCPHRRLSVFTLRDCAGNYYVSKRSESACFKLLPLS